MFFGGNFWSCGRRGDGRGIVPTFRRLHLMHRDVGLWKSRRLPPLPGPNIPGMDIPDAYSYLRNPPPVSPAAAICWQFPRFVPAQIFRLYPYFAISAINFHLDSSSYSSQNSRPILQFQESPQRNIACRFRRTGQGRRGAGWYLSNEP